MICSLVTPTTFDKSSDSVYGKAILGAAELKTEIYIIYILYNILKVNKLYTKYSL